MNNKVLDKKSMMFNFWKYFMLFAAAILLALWLFQIVFLNRFYETMKIREVTKTGDSLKNEFKNKNFENIILNYSQNKGMNIEVIDEEGYLVYPLNWVEVIMNPRVLDERGFEEFFENVGPGKKTYRVTLKKFKYLENSSIVYGGYLGKESGKDHYVLIKTNLEPVDSAVDILKNILLIVLGLSFALSVILSYFISKRLSRPLVEMSKTARKLGKGNYEVNFKYGDYTEINDLSKTLNYATNELTKTIEMRKDLIANVSHDLKTPLTVIKSYAEMIRDISGSNEVLRNEHIDIIISESDKLTQLVNDLLDISKIESSLESAKRERVDLVELSKNVIDRFTVPSNVIELATNGECVIFADKRRIEQVIYNFISNALKYTGKNKKILIKIVEDGDLVVFNCIDNGVGIAKENIDSIWNRFYRIRDNHTRPRVGTGLGLHIVKSILEIHQYEYGVESEVNKGSRFYFKAKKYK
ncbi:sensor histidine kinase [Peptoniphilus asaccharolyticus]|uniref:sensor histidine kinase n=1 Tax=Peptoniphilus asaccharolyticus TaxID=1258 RepID=UPI001EE4C9E5|nr:HAMP domain-containing sensor histidine kinase [Peptoniphilus asaccharolyticus]